MVRLSDTAAAVAFAVASLTVGCTAAGSIRGHDEDRSLQTVRNERQRRFGSNKYWLCWISIRMGAVVGGTKRFPEFYY